MKAPCRRPPPVQGETALGQYLSVLLIVWMDLCVKCFVYDDVSWDRVEGLTEINSTNQGALGWFLFIQATDEFP